MFRTLLTLVLSLVTTLAWAQPSMLHVLERVRASHPSVWHAAHRDYPQTGVGTTKAQAELFVRIAAWEMNREHLGTDHEGRWGVNGKRGDCGDLSQDVITYQIRPNWNKGWDVIGGAGGPNPSLGWGSGFEPAPDSAGCFVLGTPILDDEIAHVMAGGRPFAPRTFPWSGVPLAEAASEVMAAFEAKFTRPMASGDIGLFVSWAAELGWTGGDRMPRRVIDGLLERLGTYSGDPVNPYPGVSVDEALRRLNERWQARFGRDVHPIELKIIADYAVSRWNGQGNVPLWLLDEILAASDGYDGSLVASVPDAVDPLAEASFTGGTFTLNGEPRHWDGVTAFILQYDWFHARPRYEAFVEAVLAGGVKTVRVGIGVATGYLTLRPRSGGTFGLGRTAALYPGDGIFNWPGYRAMLADLNQRGLFVEVVPFLTAGPPARGQGDGSVPQMQTAAGRMAYMQEAARELLPMRALVIEVANEYNQIGFANDGLEIDALALAYKAIDPTRQVTTSAYHPRWGDYRTMHMERMTTPRSWSWVVNQLRYPRPGLYYTINDEGINADTDGEFGNDPTPVNHWANGVLSRLVPGFGYTFHYDRALKGLAPSAADGSLQAINAWRDGTHAVPLGIEGDYISAPNVLGADAAIARLGATEGWLLLIGSTTDSIDVPGWHEELVGVRGPHRLYRLSQ